MRRRCCRPPSLLDALPPQPGDLSETDGLDFIGSNSRAIVMAGVTQAPTCPGRHMPAPPRPAISLVSAPLPRQPALLSVLPRRSLALHLPWLAAERRRVAGPWASWETERQQRRLAALS